MPNTINALPEGMSYDSVDPQWVAQNWREFSAALKTRLSWYGWLKAVYFKEGQIRARHTYAHNAACIKVRRKVRGVWRGCYVTAPDGYSFPTTEYVDKHIVYLDGTLYFFPHISGHRVNAGRYNNINIELVIEFFEECRECGVPEPRHGLVRRDGLCPSCYERQRMANRPPEILNYTAKPFDAPFPKHELRFGIELEIVEKTSRSTYLKDVRDKIDSSKLIFKRDGSIGDNGVELVTAPLLEQDIYHVADRIFEKMSDLMAATDVCGMHVHVSKAPLSELQRGKIIAFLNNRDNDKFLRAVAGREPNHYCSPLGSDKLSHGFRNGRRSAWSRYTHYNIEPRYSDEFRMFASTTNKETFLTRFEFVNALVKYCAPGATHLPLSAHKAYKNFVNWVTRFRKFYPNLFNFFVTAEVL